MTKKSYPSDRQEQFMLRLPDGMRDRIKAAAEANNRSMNAEIVAALEDKFPDDADLGHVSLQLLLLKHALYADKPDMEDMRRRIEFAEEGLEAFKRRLIRGDRGGTL